MELALWVIAVCEIFRVWQNMIQLRSIAHDARARDNAYSEFVKSLKQSDREFVRNLLNEFEREETE